MPKPFPTGSRLAHGIRHGYRSGLEYDVALSLSGGRVASCEWEPEKLPYQTPPETHNYTPDFRIKTNAEKTFFIECKGRFLPEDRAKHLLVRKDNPGVDIRFLFSRAKAPIYKGSKTTLADWATKNGFLWCEKRVPQEWLDE